MKIQISDKRIIPDALTVWHQAGPNVDIVMDPKNLTFGEGLITELYAFHVVERLFPEEIVQALSSWYRCLATAGKIHAVSDDFQYIARAFVGGDISIEMFNNIHNHASHLDQDYLVGMLTTAGFKPQEVNVWLDNAAPDGITKQHFEFILTAVKNVTK